MGNLLDLSSFVATGMVTKTTIVEEGQKDEMGLWDGKFQVPQGIVRTEEMDIVDTMERQFTSGKQDVRPK